MVYDVIIIGAGPAGMTAGIYAARAGMKVAMLEKGAPGGQMVTTHEVENFPGFAKIGGPELSMEMFNHTQAQGVEYLYGDVEEVIDGEVKIIKCADTEYKTYSIVVATGTVNNKLGVENEDKFSANGISWCAICDGAFHKNNPVAVIGGGNSAIEEALYLTSLASKVYIIHRRDTFRADPVAVDRAKDNDKIEFILNSTVDGFSGDSKLNGVNVTLEDGTKRNLEVTGVFEYVGQSPNTTVVSKLDITNERGYILVDRDMKTSKAGIFAAGDVTEKHLRQIATAVSDGAIAAQEASKYVEALKK